MQGVAQPSPAQPSPATRRITSLFITSGPPLSGAAPGTAPGRTVECQHVLQPSWRCSGSLPYGAIFCSVQP